MRCFIITICCQKYIVLVCEMTSADVAKLARRYPLFKSCRSSFYSMDPLSTPNRIFRQYMIPPPGAVRHDACCRWHFVISSPREHVNKYQNVQGIPKKYKVCSEKGPSCI